MADITGMLQAAAGAGGAEETDANFNQTVLLLHGDGTNGAQNNTFVDSSTNNFTITRNGNTTQGTFSPFSAPDGRWSNYFDGTGDYLTAGSASDWSFLHNGASFTIEAWIYFQRPSSLPASYVILNNAQTTAETGIQFFVRESTSKLEFQILRASSGNYAVALVSTATIAENTWTHVAVSLDGSDEARLFINGSLDTQATASNFSATTAPYTLNIGRYPHTNVNFWTGYISNLRIVDGSALYTSTFTPSTTPLTAVSGTELLTCQSNRFVDNSSNAFAITVNGNPKVTPFSPFAPTAAYSASVNGGSGYFDGNDHLSLADNAAFNFDAEFTIEAWGYRTTSGVTQAILAKWASGQEAWLVRIEADNTIKFWYENTSITTTAVVPTNSWFHVAVTRDSSDDIRVFLNGTQTGSTTNNSVNITSTTSTYVGAYSSSGSLTSYFTGYIASARVVKGSAIYTANFTPPTSALTAVSGTSLLCNFTNAGIFDQTGKNNLETVGNAQIDTTTKKYGTGSMEFDGTGDYLLMNGGENFAFGTGDFTIEMWAYFNNTGTTVQLYDARPANTNGAYLRIGRGSGNNIFVYVSGSNVITGSATISSGTWYHIAVCRASGSTKLFVDGTQEGSTYSDSTNYLNPSLRPVIGAEGFSFGSGALNGYIDDLRITKGVARYTSAFTPPTKEFPNL